jgi:ferredoxin
MAAITVEDAAVVDRDRCIGCGVCIADCPTEAIALHLKDDAEQYVPPRNVMETYVKMAQERGKL